MNAETKRCFAALLRKQRREQSAFLNRSARTGKQRTKTGKLAFGALYGAIALVLMASFASLSWPLAQLLLPGGWETLYFLVLELLALLVSVLAGALSSYNRLFQAKDNDLLLALPIPPWMIFAVRLWGLYEMSLFYLLLVWVPAEAAYVRFAPHPLGGILSAVPMALLLAGAASVLAALLGWAVALLVAKAGRHKALFTVVASLGFLALYFLGYQKSGALLNTLLSSALWGGGEGLPQGSWLLLGRAACGDIPALLGLLISLAAVCAVLGKLLSGPYLRLMTTRTGGAASKMKAAPHRPGRRQAASRCDRPCCGGSCSIWRAAPPTCSTAPWGRWGWWCSACWLCTRPGRSGCWRSSCFRRGWRERPQHSPQPLGRA